MPRGRPPRVVTATLPPKGYYVSHLAPLAAVRTGRISPAAAHLWTVLRAHAWQDGRCDLTDEELGGWLGGLSVRQISNLRAALVAAGLLVILNGGPGGARWLVPQPAIELQSISGEMYFTRNAPLEEEEVKLVKINPNTPPPPEVRVNNPGRIDRQSISPEIHFTGNGLPVNAGGAGPVSEAARLAAFLVEQGAFPAVAAGLAQGLLARRPLAAAQVHALAHLTAIEHSADVRQRRIYGEQIIGRWVARLREGATPPRWAVQEAENALAARARAVDGEFAEEDWAAEATAGAEDALAVDASVPEERPWLTGEGRAYANRELWDVALAQLRLQLPRSTFETWLRASQCRGRDETGRTLVVQVDSSYAVDWLTRRLKPLVLRTLAGLTGLTDLDVRFEEVA